MFCKKGVLIDFAKFRGKHLCQSFFFNKVAGRSPTLLKKRLWHRCFPVNFQKFLRTHFLTEHLRWLLLNKFSHSHNFHFTCIKGWKSHPDYLALDFFNITNMFYKLHKYRSSSQDVFCKNCVLERTKFIRMHVCRSHF